MLGGGVGVVALDYRKRSAIFTRGRETELVNRMPYRTVPYRRIRGIRADQTRWTTMRRADQRTKHRNNKITPSFGGCARESIVSAEIFGDNVDYYRGEI